MSKSESEHQRSFNVRLVTHHAMAAIAGFVFVALVMHVQMDSLPVILVGAGAIGITHGVVTGRMVGREIIRRYHS